MTDIVDRLKERCWPLDSRDELCMDAVYVITDLRERLAAAERIVNAVALVHKEANLNGGRIVLNEGCALFLGAWQYRNRYQATAVQETDNAR